MKKTVLVLIAAFMTFLLANAEDIKFKYDISIGENPAGVTLSFGREDGAKDGYDDKDAPMAPSTPIDPTGTWSDITFIYFAGTDSQSEITPREGIDNFETLGIDMRDPSTPSSTWKLIFKTPEGTSLLISWALDAAVGNAPTGSLSLEDSTGNKVCANMLTASSCTLPSVGTYYIKYKAEGAEEAPATPDPIDISVSVYEGSTITQQIITDVEKYKAVNISVTYFDQDGNDITENIPNPGGPGSQPVYDEATGVLTYSVLPGDYASIKIFYDITRKDNAAAGTAQGVIRAAVEYLPVLTLKSNAKETVDYVNPANKNEYNPVTIRYELVVPAEYFNDKAEDAGENRILSVPARFTLPDWKCSAQVTDVPWSCTVKVGNQTYADGTDYIVKHNPETPAAGDNVVTVLDFTETHISITEPGLTQIEFTLTPDIKAKGGKTNFVMTVKNDQNNDEQLPSDDTATTVAIALKGDGNLDVDNSDEGKAIAFLDIIYIYRYRFLGGKTSPLNLVRGTANEGNEELAIFIRDNIAAIEDRIKFENESSPQISFLDIIFIYRYRFLNGSSNAAAIIAGTQYNSDKGLEIQGKISDLIVR